VAGVEVGHDTGSADTGSDIAAKRLHFLCNDAGCPDLFKG
jgi:lipoate synthase